MSKSLSNRRSSKVSNRQIDVTSDVTRKVFPTFYLMLWHCKGKIADRRFDSAAVRQNVRSICLKLSQGSSLFSICRLVVLVAALKAMSWILMHLSGILPTLGSLRSEVVCWARIFISTKNPCWQFVRKVRMHHRSKVTAIRHYYHDRR